MCSSEMPRAEMDDIFIPALRMIGKVTENDDGTAVKQIAADEDYKTSCVERKKKLENFDEIVDFGKTLLNFHGKGGSRKKRRRLARRVSKNVDVAQTACAHNLREVATATMHKESDSTDDSE